MSPHLQLSRRLIRTLAALLRGALTALAVWGLSGTLLASAAVDLECPSCDDFNYCTVDACDTRFGTCRHDPIVCENGNPCRGDFCDPMFGCRDYPLADGTACGDGDPCTQGDACVAGNCAGSPLAAGDACDDANPCTSDEHCDGGGACVASALLVGDPCDDGDLCTTGDACVASGEGVPTCEGTATSCDDENPCTDDACDGATGICAHPPAPCDDGNPCTSDTCVALAEAGCEHAPVDATCSDGNACTIGDACVAGNCIGPSPASCDDGVGCTDDVCDSHEEPHCRHFTDDSKCSIYPCVGNSCDCLDPPRCTDHGCVVPWVAGRRCNTDNPCYISVCSRFSCDPVVFLCSDGDRCTWDACGADGCSHGPLTCGDDNPCTDDSCDSATGCQHTSNTGPCDDDRGCTVGDHCAGGACQPGAYNTCDDGNGCTRDDCNEGSGECLHELQHCDDGNPCTDDTCDPAAGCHNEPNAAHCDDANACTTDFCNLAGCQHLPVECYDGIPCTEDVCDPAVGCGIPDHALCDDGDPCVADICDRAVGCRYELFTGNPITCGVGACERTVDSCVDGAAQDCVPGEPSRETCNGIDDDCDGETDEGRIAARCAILPETIDRSAARGGFAFTCVLTDVCDPAHPLPVPAGDVSRVYLARADRADTGEDDVTFPAPESVACPDASGGTAFERGVVENLNDRLSRGNKMAFRFNLRSDGDCRTLGGNRRDLGALLAGLPDGTAATICIAGTARSIPFQGCAAAVVKAGSN